MDVNSIGNLLTPATMGKEKAQEGTGFAEMLGNAVKEVRNTQQTAAEKTIAVASGEDVPMHEVIQAVGKAELTLETMITLRDRTVEAYQEILRMPI